MLERLISWIKEWVPVVMILSAAGAVVTAVGTCVHGDIVNARLAGDRERQEAAAAQLRRNRAASEFIESIRNGPCRDYSMPVPEDGRATCIRADQKLEVLQAPNVEARVRCTCKEPAR